MAAKSLARRDPGPQRFLDYRRNFDELFSRMFSTPPSAWIPPAETTSELYGNGLTISGERAFDRNIPPPEEVQSEIELRLGPDAVRNV